MNMVRGADSVLLLVGPEGGWDRAELDLAFSNNCRPLTLGGRTLRADAAPLVSLSVLLHALGEL
jgi:16S rRNA (uracil1498-N3)-methyltransferase